MNIFEIEGTFFILLFFVKLVVSIFAFINSLLYSAEAYEAAGKLTKTTWCTILGLGVALQFVAINLALVGLVLLIAALVYLADVRPALAGLTRR